jgi:ubiquinone/menaquinone biosynthesis C-methylase UbiE
LAFLFLTHILSNMNGIALWGDAIFFLPLIGFSMTSGYDKLAPVYDWLAVFFVGKQIQQAQLKWLSYLSDRKKLLILGGGTGWMLPAVFQINPNLVIHYVDASAKMIAQAQANAQ